MHESRLYLGALYIIGAELMFASMGATIRFVSDDLNNPMVVFARNLIGLLFLLPWLLRNGPGSFKTRVPHLHLLRGLAGVSAMYCFFYAIAHMPLANAMLLKLTAPLFIPIIALFWLQERFTWHVVAALTVGFAGVGVILAPDLASASSVSLIALAGGAFAAVAKVTVRRLSRSESGPLIVFYFAATGLLVSSLPLPWFWQTPTPEQLRWLVLLALFATAGQLLLTRGMASAPAARLGPFTFFSVLFGAALGWFLWDEQVTLATSVGALLILLSAFLTGRGRKRQTRIADPVQV
jgi:drug/metabolite transporter (DMT)-like permease